MKTLLIYRHGHAQEYVDTYSAGGDFARELRDKGKRNAQRVGIWLARQSLIPQRLISSPATRAKRTAEKTMKTAGCSATMVEQDQRLYLAGLETLLTVVREQKDTLQSLMLVGHNPGLERIIDYLSDRPLARNPKGMLLSPAALACIQFDGSWRSLGQSSVTVKNLLYPRSLPRLFPWPTLQDAETRSRPAYYYKQSSVIPYRFHMNELQVLIITSSKNRHWVVPKGIHDPGLTAQQSAAKEAFEEAGVLGEVPRKVNGQANDISLGSYRYTKWDAECEVTVYPMLVTEQLDPPQWQESHRQRRWVTVEQAARQLHNPDVSNIVRQLPEYLGKMKHG